MVFTQHHPNQLKVDRTHQAGLGSCVGGGRGRDGAKVRFYIGFYLVLVEAINLKDFKRRRKKGRKKEEKGRKKRKKKEEKKENEGK